MKIDKQKYKVYTWKNWMMLHWIINPGMAINEMILGQRIPKISLLDKTLQKPKHDRSFVPCPHCETIHDSRIWSPQNKTGFKNWFGLYCTNCGGIIPCIINGFSFLILAITFPIWGWFKNNLKQQWLDKQPKRYENIDIEATPNPYSKNNWVRTGLVWGVLMYLLTTFLFPYLNGEEIETKEILLGFPLWVVAGLIFGFTLKKFND